jgi:ATP-binding cassette subfamily B protein
MLTKSSQDYGYQGQVEVLPLKLLTYLCVFGACSMMRSYNDKVSPNFLAFSATTKPFSTGISWRNIYRFRMSIYIQKTDYVLVDGNRKLLNLLSISMIAIVLLQYIGFV